MGRGFTDCMMMRAFFTFVLLLFLTEHAWSGTFESLNREEDVPVVTTVPDDSLYYNQVVRLKNGTTIVGRVEYDEATDRFTIKTKSGEIKTILRRDVEVVEEYSRTYLPPVYRPMSFVLPCDIRQRDKQWFFLELRGWGYYAGEDESDPPIGLNAFTLGGEVAGGIRFAKRWGLGLGVSYFRSREIDRIPVFLHGRYELALTCIAPFLYAQLGTVFDSQSGESIGTSNLLSPAPKILGFGIGLDYALTPAIDLSADLGYRHLVLPTKVPCDCSDVPPIEQAVIYNEIHGILLRLGVTF